MKNDDSILPKLDFEDKTILLSMLDNIISSTSHENLLKKISKFTSCLFSQKLIQKIKEYEKKNSSQIQTTQHMTSSIKILKIFCILQIYKTKFYHSEDYEKNILTDINLVIHSIYKLLSTSDKNEHEIQLKNDSNELDIITNIILNKYILTKTLNSNQIITFDALKKLLDSNEKELNLNFLSDDKQNSKKLNGQAVTSSFNNFSYDTFNKYFRILVKFYVFRDNFSHLFNVLQKNNKLMSAELIICINKLIRGLNDSNGMYLISKKFLDMIDSNQIYISKEEFYIMFLRAII